MRNDIGEAKIIHTIFGRAKVRIIREQDNKRRAWLLSVLAVTVLAAAAWQGWVATNRTTPPPLSARIQVSAPAFQPEFLPPATSLSAMSKPETPPKIGIINPATSQKSAAQQLPGLKAAEPMVAKPVASQLLPAIKPQAAPFAANNSPSKNQASMQQLPKPSVQSQPEAPVAKIPPVVTQSAAGSTAAAVPLAVPLAREAASTRSPTAIDQSVSSVSAQGN